MASRIWRFLTTDISELVSIDTTDNTVKATKPVSELSDVLAKGGENVDQLALLVSEIDLLLDALNSLLAEIVEKSLRLYP